MSFEEEIRPDYSQVDKLDQSKGGFTTKVMHGGEEMWQLHGEVLKAVFADYLKTDLDLLAIVIGQQMLEDMFSAPEATIVLLKSGDTIVGYTCAYPAQLHPEGNYVLEKEQRTRNIEDAEFMRMQEKTTEVGWTVIAPESRHKGGWTLLMNELEDALRNDPHNYEYMIRYVRNADNYSQKVGRRYAGNIDFRDSFEDKHLGPQTFYRVRLARPTPGN